MAAADGMALALLGDMRAIALLILPAVTAACVSDDGTEDPLPPVVDSGAYRHFVQTGWTLPNGATEARWFGFDFDADGSIDNSAGSVVGSLAAIGLDLGGASATAFESGQLVTLHSVRADALVDDGSVSWHVLSGARSSPPRFDGTDQFRVTGSDGELVGAIIGGRADLRWGVVGLAVPFFPDQPPLVMPIAEARIAADLDDDGCAGRIGGVIVTADIETTLLRLAAQAIVHIERNPTHEFAIAAHSIFDTNNDGRITVDEIAGSSIARSLLQPDVDLDHDNLRDGLSFGLGFDCVPATFRVIGEV